MKYALTIAAVTAAYYLVVAFVLWDLHWLLNADQLTTTNRVTVLWFLGLANLPGPLLMYLNK